MVFLLFCILVDRAVGGGGYSPPPAPLSLATLLIMLLPGRISIALGPWQFGDFRNIFLPNVGEDHKKSSDLSAGLLAGTAPYCGKSGFG